MLNIGQPQSSSMAAAAMAGLAQRFYCSHIAKLGVFVSLSTYSGSEGGCSHWGSCYIPSGSGRNGIRPLSGYLGQQNKTA